MKLRQQPDDFLVEELTDTQPGSSGEYSLYRLEKTGWTTPDAVQVIRRRWQLDRNRMSFGGLKDRHALTVQYLSIWRGPRRDLTQQGIILKYLGQFAEPYTSRCIRANRFRLVVRSLSAELIAAAAGECEDVRLDGVPNYFDDQRFGSVSEGEFVGKALVQGDFARALQLALTAPYEHDRAAQKKEKAILKAHWGDWPTCLAKLERGHARALVNYLASHHDDFRGAMARLRPELRGLYLSAYQSDLWNRMLAKWLHQHVAEERLRDLELRTGVLPMFVRLNTEERRALASLTLPLPTARGKVDAEDSRSALMTAVLEEEGVRREQLKVKGLREVFFSKGHRAALCVPKDLLLEPGDDELNSGRGKLTLAFELPRGSYATLIVKRLLLSDEKKVSAPS